MSAHQDESSKQSKRRTEVFQRPGDGPVRGRSVPGQVAAPARSAASRGGIGPGLEAPPALPRSLQRAGVAPAVRTATGTPSDGLRAVTAQLPKPVQQVRRAAFGIDLRVVASERCATAFGRMVWAFPFLFDVRVSARFAPVAPGRNLDLLPDCVGWFLFATALHSICGLAPRVARLRNLAILLGLVSLPNIMGWEISYEGFAQHPERTSAALAMALSTSALNLLFIWKLCGLVEELALAVEDRVLQAQAGFRRRFFLAFTLGVVASIAIALVVPGFLLVAFLLGFPLALALTALLMGLMSSTQKLCREVGRT